MLYFKVLAHALYTIEYYSVNAIWAARRMISPKFIQSSKNLELRLKIYSHVKARTNPAFKGISKYYTRAGAAITPGF